MWGDVTELAQLIRCGARAGGGSGGRAAGRPPPLSSAFVRFTRNPRLPLSPQRGQDELGGAGPGRRGRAAQVGGPVPPPQAHPRPLHDAPQGGSRAGRAGRGGPAAPSADSGRGRAATVPGCCWTGSTSNRLAHPLPIPAPKCPQVPNGELTADQLRFLGDCIRPYGADGCADITTRANIQVRAVCVSVKPCWQGWPVGPAGLGAGRRGKPAVRAVSSEAAQSSAGQRASPHVHRLPPCRLPCPCRRCRSCAACSWRTRMRSSPACASAASPPSWCGRPCVAGVCCVASSAGAAAPPPTPICRPGRAPAPLLHPSTHSPQSGMDNVRNITGSPIAGIDPHELLDSRPLCHGGWR